MKLITKQLEKQIPSLRKQSENKIEDLVFYAKLFTPWTSITWYIAEANWETGECFGLVVGFDVELGYFNIKELEELRSIEGLKIERDKWFEKCTHKNLMEEKQ